MIGKFREFYVRLFLLATLSLFACSCSTGKPKVQPQKVDQKGIRLVFFKNQSVLSGCYDKELANRPDTQGRLYLDFDIIKGGVVKNEEVSERSELKSKGLHSCILTALKGFQFPEPPQENIRVNVLYPMAFHHKK